MRYINPYSSLPKRGIILYINLYTEAICIRNELRQMPGKRIFTVSQSIRRETVANLLHNTHVRRFTLTDVELVRYETIFLHGAISILLILHGAHQFSDRNVSRSERSETIRISAIEFAKRLYIGAGKENGSKREESAVTRKSFFYINMFYF